MEYKAGNIYPPSGSKIDPKRRKKIDLQRKLKTLVLNLRGDVKVKIK